MKNVPTLSVVIPVYKVEQYLERCVNSVLEQDFKDIEVILVDDGSPDRCPEICDRYAHCDSRVRVIHKENGGLSSARNKGIEVAIGKYIAFVDSDDQWKAGMLKPVMKKVLESNAQMILFGSLDAFENGEIYQRDDMGLFEFDGRQMTPLELYPLLIKYGNFHEHACTKILNLSFVRDNNLTFVQGILGEDTEWMFRLMRVVKRIQLSSIALYIYTFNRKGSITNTASTKSVIDIVYTINKSLDFYNKGNNCVKDYEISQCSYLWSLGLGLYNNVPCDQKKEVKRLLIETKTKLDLSNHPKSRKVNEVYNLFGFEITAFVLKIYMFLLRLNIVNRKSKING